MSGQEDIMRRVREALAALPERTPLPDWDRELIHRQGETALADQWDIFAGQMTATGGTPLDRVGALVTLLEENRWQRGYCDPKLWPRLRPEFGEKFRVETVFDRTRIDDYDFGITRAVAGIAETGTLVLGDHTTSSRLAALAPWVHVAVIDPAVIHADITTALTHLPDDPNLIWITGPSKTADIEGILIEGVHGPGRQVALCQPDSA